MQSSLPRDNRGVIIDPKHSTDWIVPRRVMCAFFWIGIVLLFTGIILLVTGRHKGKVSNVYQSWGGILLGLGFCLLLICLILCLHAYCVITITEDQPHQRKNIPPPAPLIANGKKPRERTTGSGRPAPRRSVEPVSLLIIEREDVGSNPRSYNSMGSTGRTNPREPNGNLGGRPSNHNNGIIPNGPVAHPVTLVGTLTRNTASVSRSLPPLVEDDKSNESVSTENSEIFLGNSPTPSPRNQSPNIVSKDTNPPSYQQSMSYSKNGMTIRSNPLDNPFPPEDIIQNVDNDSRLKQNDLSSTHLDLDGKLQNTNSPEGRHTEQIPDVLYATPRKIKRNVNRGKSADDLDTSSNKPDSISSIQNIPLENVNPQIKKFIDRVGLDAEAEGKVESDNKPLNVEAAEGESPTESDNGLKLAEKNQALSENSQHHTSDGPYSVVEARNKGVQVDYSPRVLTPANSPGVTKIQLSKNINEPQYAVVNKPKPKTASFENFAPGSEKVKNSEMQIGKERPNTETQRTENTSPPRSPNSIEFHRRMQRILEKQELEKQKRSPRREKKNFVYTYQNSSPIIQTNDQFTQQHNLEGQKCNGEAFKSQVNESSVKDPSYPITVNSPVPIDSGISTTINSRKSPILHKPQPVTYCKHCGSGHVNNGTHEVVNTAFELEPSSVAADTKNCQTLKATPSSTSPGVERKTDPITPANAPQYSWSDTTGAVVRAGARPKTTVSTTLPNPGQDPKVHEHDVSNKSNNANQVSRKPPLAPSTGKSFVDHRTGAVAIPPQPSTNTRGRIAVTSATMFKQMHQEQQKLLQSQESGNSTSAGAAFDPSAALQQILLKQAVAHHHGRDVRRFSNPKVVYLGPDMEVTASKVSIYDNVQYVWKDDHDPH